ncbi:hypothetical protein D3C80_1496530 [compost metagenome]
MSQPPHSALTRISWPGCQVTPLSLVIKILGSAPVCRVTSPCVVFLKIIPVTIPAIGMVLFGRFGLYCSFCITMAQVAPPSLVA